MQCKFLVAFVAACLALTVSAAPVAEAAVARVAEPDREHLMLPRVEESREPQPGCSLYTCICLSDLQDDILYHRQNPPSIPSASPSDQHTGALLLVSLLSIVSSSLLGYFTPTYAAVSA
ncbi:hypothetical protein C8R43DRAFT_1116307 [Mycena crocata]|nr:hypothetical protein C8R43DRAFT_1116307 [Mycena crocata]